MPFAYDYSAVGRWVLEEGLDTVTIEPSGRVVFSCFDIDPAMFVGVAWHEATFDEVADGPPRPGCEARWAAAGARLRWSLGQGLVASLLRAMAPGFLEAVAHQNSTRAARSCAWLESSAAELEGDDREAATGVPPRAPTRCTLR